jgi:hypothetical protein
MGSFTMQPGEYVILVDHERRVVWMRAEDNDVPVFKVVPFGARMR